MTDPADTLSATGLGRHSAAEPAELIRSEVRLRVHTNLATVGSVRLEKYLVTQTKTITVDVVTEHVRLIYTAADGTQTSVEDPPATTPQAAAGSAPDESSRWLVLHEERVAVTKEQVPVQRIRLDTYLITENRQVSEPVRVERIEVTDTTATADTADQRAPRA